MDYAKTFGKQIGKTTVEIDGIIKDMMSGDYENLVNIFDEQFGSFVTLYT